MRHNDTNTVPSYILGGRCIGGRHIGGGGGRCTDIILQVCEFINPTIKFTIERSDAADHQEQVPFLDTLISVRSDGQYSTQLYIKPVAASIIIPFDSR